MGLTQKLGVAGLGVATGTIIIDTSALKGAAAVARNYGTQLLSGMSGGSAAVQKQDNAFQGLERTLKRLTLQAGAITGLGVAVASYFEQALVVVKGLVRDEEKALVLNEKIRDTAREMGISYGELLHATRLILPTMEGQTDELEEQWQIIRRVAVLNPAQGIAMAAFAVNEALVSGGQDLMSLAERFNVSRSIFREEFVKSNRDFWHALDATLNRMGITAQVAEQMSDTFQASFKVMRDSLLQLTAEGFSPIIRLITPIIKGMADWAAEARGTNSAILTLGAGMAGLLTVGGPLLLMLAQLKTSIAVLGLASIVGRTGLLGITAVVGAAAGYGAIKTVGAMTGSEQIKNVTVNDLVEQAAFELGKILLGLAGAAMGADAALRNFVANLAEFHAAIGEMVIQAYSMLISLMPPGLRKPYEAERERARTRIENYRATAEEYRSGQGILADTLWKAASSYMNALYSHKETTTYGAAPDLGKYTVDQTTAMQQWAAGVKSIEEKAAQSRLDATKEFEAQRLQFERSHFVSLQREAQDYYRSLQRQAEDLARSIANIREEQALREASWWEDYYDELGEAREEAAEALNDIEEEHQRERERLLREHQERLLSAAAKLDAAAVAQEQRSFALQLQNLNEDHQRQRDRIRESLDEQTEDALEALNERIEDAREADARRIQEMEDNLAFQQAREAEDRALRLQRQEEDYIAQKAQMEQNFQDRLEQINTQEATALAAHNTAFETQMASLNLFNIAYLTKTEQTLNDATTMWENFWADWHLSMEDALDASLERDVWGGVQGVRRPGTSVGEYQAGGPVNRTGLALVHAGEYVLNEATTRALAGAMNGPLTGTGIANALSNRNILIEEGAIQIYGAQGQDVKEIGFIVRSELIAALQYAN